MYTTIPMLGAHVLSPRLIRVEMLTAAPAVMVVGAFHVMLFSCVDAREVDIAVITGPMEAGVLLVLLEGTVVRKRS